MKKKICIAQTIEELKFLLSNIEKNVLVVPLDLEVQIYCIKNKINFIDPLNYIKNHHHKIALNSSEKILKSLKYKNVNFESHKVIIRAFIRFHFNSIFFLINLIKEICKKNNIQSIILSGWQQYKGEYHLNNYWITSLIKKYFKSKNLIILTKLKIRKKEKLKFQDISISTYHLDKKKNYVLLSSLGYNFFRFIKFFREKNYNILSPYDKNINFIKRNILQFFFKVNFFKFSVTKKNLKKYKLPNVKFSYKDKIIENELRKRFNQEINNLTYLQNKSKAIDDFFNTIKINLVISHNVRGDNGYYLERSNKNNIESICVPHGTVSEPFNRHDKVYKNTIAEAVIFAKTKYIAAQSRISDRFFIKNKNFFFKKNISTGNLIFAESIKKSITNKKNKILYAVTIKKFFNQQFLGVETFYEFLDNLKFLNYFSKINKIKIYVNLHPAAKNSLNDLKELFPNLSFINKKIDEVLKKVDMTISFSSTVIEDSLCSKIPVILFDRWRRYQHCSAEKNFLKKNSPIYYVKKNEDLIKCVNTIYNSSKISYKKHIFVGNFKANIKNLFNSLNRA